MILPPHTFYKFYMKDYHSVKAAYLLKMIENSSKYEQEFLEKDFNADEKRYFSKTLKSDLRQTYYHAIETFFELLFAILPRENNALQDKNVMFNLTNSNWQKNYKQIERIASDIEHLDFFDDEIVVNNHNVSIGHYIFYLGFFSKEKFPEELFENIKDSIQAIKYGIRILAQDFTKKEEYNSYKHGLRIMPMLQKMGFYDSKSSKRKKEWDVSESMTYYLRTKNHSELTSITKIFDSKRDYCMINFCSNLINQIISFRKIALDPERKKHDDKVEIRFFGIEEIKKCAKTDVEIQDIVYNIKRG